jgi:hypothetical protein
VKPLVAVMPSAITFVARPGEKMIERTLTVTYDRPVQVKKLASDAAAVTLSSEASTSARTHVIAVAIDPTQLRGRFRAELEITTDHPTVPLQRVSIVGRIK